MASSPSSAAETCTPLPPAARDKGVEAFLADRSSEAVSLLLAVVKADPRDRAADAFRRASAKKLAAARKSAQRDLAARPKVVLAPLPLARTLRKPIEAPAEKLRLEKLSQAANKITDSADWEKKNGVVRHDPEEDELPPEVPRESMPGRRMRTFVHRDHIAVVEGQDLVIVAAPGKEAVAFDTSRTTNVQSFARPTVSFAQLVGKHLVLGLGHNGYAKESNGKTAYMASFDATTGALDWVSEPLVSNSAETVISGGTIVTGYGFTAEPDFVFTLDLATGNVEQKLPVKSGPELFRPKGDRLFVRTYDMDYVFKASAPFGPTLPPAMKDDGAGAPAVDAETTCWVKHAAAAVAARDPKGIEDAAAHLYRVSRDRALAEMLAAEAKELAMPDRIDLTTAPLVVAAAPPWKETLGPAAPRTGRKLVKVSSRPTRSRFGREAFDPEKPFHLAPIDRGRLPEAARADIPSSYGGEFLSAILPGEKGRSALIYGGRFVALLEGSTTKTVLDLDAYRVPPVTRSLESWDYEDATYAMERDGIVYVCNGAGSYAKDVGGKKGFLSAIEAATAKLVWRSAPLVCNTDFVMTDDVIVTGYGFTQEPDALFLLRRADGAIEQKLPVDTAPTSLVLEGKRLRAEVGQKLVELELR